MGLHVCSTHLHLWGLADSQFEGAPLDVLVIQTESQWKVPFFGHNVNKLISPVLVIDNFSVHDAAIWSEYLNPQGCEKEPRFKNYVWSECINKFYLIFVHHLANLSWQNCISTFAGTTRLVSCHYGNRCSVSNNAVFKTGTHCFTLTGHGAVKDKGKGWRDLSDPKCSGWKQKGCVSPCGDDGPQVVDRLPQSVCLYHQIQLVVLLWLTWQA